MKSLLLDTLASIPAYMAFNWDMLPHASRTAERRRASALRSSLVLNNLSPLESDIFEGLERNGVFVTHLDALGLDSTGEDIISLGRSVASSALIRAQSKGAAQPSMIVSNAMDLERWPGIYRWGLNAVLLRIAECYLRRPVAYDGPLVFHTFADGKELSTRRWHLDREDTRMMKVALYLNDVDENGGPFEILCREVLRRQDSSRYEAFDTRKLETVYGKALRSDIRTCTGRKGTLVFADTARYYHRGRPAVEEERSAVFFSYFGQPPAHPYFCNRNKLSRAQIDRMSFGLHPAQLESALWRDCLPLRARLMPPSRI